MQTARDLRADTTLTPDPDARGPVPRRHPRRLAGRVRVRRRDHVHRAAGDAGGARPAELPLVTANAIFLAPVPPGPVEIDVEVLRDGRNASQVAADLHVPARGSRAARARRVRRRARHRPRVPGRALSPRCRSRDQIAPPPLARPPEPVRRDQLPRADRVAAGEPARRSRPGPVHVVGAAASRAATPRRLARPAHARGARRRARPRGRPRLGRSRHAVHGAVARDRHPLRRDAGDAVGAAGDRGVARRRRLRDRPRASVGRRAATCARSRPRPRTSASSDPTSRDAQAGRTTFEHVAFPGRLS